MSLYKLHVAALEIFHHTVMSLDARLAVRAAVRFDRSCLFIGDSEFRTTRPVYVVAMGKAAVMMTLGLHDILGDKISQGVISSAASDKANELPSTYTVFNGGHPTPNQESLDAAEAAFQLIDCANEERGLVLFLISGGGSAMLEWPISNEISLEDLQEANRQLITCGATISEINTVRRSLSAIKGGRLGSRVRHAKAVALILSDTNRDDEANVAAGPTVSSLQDAYDVRKVLKKYGLVKKLPASALSAIRKYKGHIDRFHPGYVVGDNDDALWAASQKALQMGFTTSFATDVNEQPVELGAPLLLKRAFDMEDLPGCLLAGGEFSCRVRGEGRGGRNLETVLRCAIELDRRKTRDHTVILSAGTDGIDGSSFAAGAIADETTISRARELGLNASDYLERSDSHAFFNDLGDLVVTGPTGTNVRDIRIVLRGETHPSS